MKEEIQVSNKPNLKDSYTGRMCLVNGVRMTINDRNIMMKLDFVNGNMSIAAIADKYDLNTDTIYSLSSSQKWKQLKLKKEQEIETAAAKGIEEVYVACGIDINMTYNNTWQKMMDIVNQILNNHKDYLFTKFGGFKFLEFESLARVITAAQEGQKFTTGWMGKEANIKIQMQQEILQLRKKAQGEDEEESSSDNLIGALVEAGQRLWGDDFGNDLINEEEEKSNDGTGQK